MVNFEKFIEDLKKQNIEIHQFVFKNDKDTLLKITTPPYTKTHSRMLFSIAKSFVSLAIGYLYEEGRLQLDDYILDYFQEYKENCDPCLKELRIVHLLTMTSGSQEDTMLFVRENWQEAFFNQRFLHHPGEKFRYNSMNTYILSILISRITGKNCLEYLDEKLFSPIGIKTPRFDVSKQDYPIGGWGLYLNVDELILFCDAMIREDPCLPLKYIRQMTKLKVTAKKHPYYDGYGYLCWMHSFDGYRFDGIFGQGILFFPYYKAYIIMMGNIIAPKSLYQLIDRYIPDWLTLSKTTQEIRYPWFKIPEVPVNIDPKEELYQIKIPGVSLLPLTIAFLDKYQGVGEAFLYKSDGKNLLLYWTEGNLSHRLLIGFDKFIENRILLNGKIYRVTCLGEKSQNQLTVHLIFLEYPFSKKLIFERLSPKKIMIHEQDNPDVEMLLEHYGHLLTFTPFSKMNSWIIEKGWHLVRPNGIALLKKKKDWHK